jgi:HEPN domain-containing protein
MKKSEIKNSAELFYYKATVDFAAAKTLLKAVNESEAEIDMDVVFFHLQQTAEKLLKSLLSYKKIRVDKTHDIESLIACCLQNQIGLTANADALSALSEFAVEGRYTVIHDDLQDVDMYIVLLDEFIKFTEKSIVG